MYRPEEWKNDEDNWPLHNAYERGADAMLEGLKKKGLYGEYLEDYIISVEVRPDDVEE